MSLVIDVLRGAKRLEPGQMDRSDLDPLLHRWRAGDARRDLHDGFVQALTHPDPRVRAGGVVFFSRMTTSADDLEILLPLFTEQPHLYDGVPEPWFGGEDDLRAWLAAAIAQRTPQGHPAVQVIQREALVPGRAAWVIVALVGLVPAWVREHATEIVAGSPRALDPLLFNLALRGIDVRPILQDLRGSVDETMLRSAIRASLGDEAAAVEADVFGA